MSSRKVRCVIIRMSPEMQQPNDIQVEHVDLDVPASDPAADRNFGQRKSVKDLLPWADPYILKLIERCQKEVAAQHQQRKADRADREGFESNWSGSDNDFGPHGRSYDVRNAFDGHPFGFEWEGDAV